MNENNNETLKDSGQRTSYSTGAVRESGVMKGRCDLLPLDIITEYSEDHLPMLSHINKYIETVSVDSLWDAIKLFLVERKWDWYTCLMEVSIQYEQGAKKYTDNNWRKGLPVHLYISSSIRHYLKWKRGDTDEHHDRAFIWNLFGAIWTHRRKPELIDFPFKEVAALPRGEALGVLKAETNTINIRCYKCKYLDTVLSYPSALSTQSFAKCVCTKGKAVYTNDCPEYESKSVRSTCI